MPVQGRGYGSIPEGVKGAVGTKGGKYITRKKKGKKRRGKSLSRSAMG